MFRIFVKLEGSKVVDELLEAVEQLSRTKTGAIIVLENDVALDDYAHTGSALEARVSREMLVTIFTPLSPLHDGAVIIAGNTIKVAGAILPLTQTRLHDKSLGTRHRAALGLAEESDALVIVVSEETARISVAHGGRLEVGVEPSRVRELLEGVVPEAAGSMRLKVSHG
jgi:diadenylate cyclase